MEATVEALLGSLVTGRLLADKAKKKGINAERRPPFCPFKIFREIDQ
jgi:hypothetical protein